MSEKGRIIKGVGGLYEVRLESGETVTCTASGIFRYDNTTVAVGDHVTIKIEPDGSAAIKSIIERRNILIRPPLANLDILFIVVAAASPDPDLTTADKLISIAEFNMIEPVVIITKFDLDTEKARYISEIYRKSGFYTFIGTEGLMGFITDHAGGKTSAFAGASGAGKTTLLNKLFPVRLALNTGELSRKTARGKHTTRHVQLYPLAELLPNAPNSLTGYLADTPGFSLLDFERYNFYSKEDLPFTFREFEQYLTKCKFTKCTHTKEEGCAVIEAVRNGLIPAERHNSFLEIYDGIKDKRAWTKYPK